MPVMMDTASRRIAAAVCGLLLLAGCDGPGGAMLDPTQSGPAALKAPPTPMLFVVTDGVVAYANPATANGDIAPTTYFWGPYGDSAPPQLFWAGVDRAGELLVLNDTRIRVFNDAATTTPNPQHDRTVAGPDIQFTSHQSAMLVDRPHDRVIVVSNALGEGARGVGAAIYDDFSQARGDNVAASRVFTSRALFAPRTAALAGNGDLYIYDDPDVFVFANAGLRSGEVPPDRSFQITDSAGAQINTIDHIFVDGNDRLYVSDPFHGFVYIIDRASSRSGLVVPDRMIDFDFLPSDPNYTNFSPLAVTVDSRGVGYILANVGGGLFQPVILIVDDIGARDGRLVADRTIQGPRTRLGTSTNLYLWE